MKLTRYELSMSIFTTTYDDQDVSTELIARITEAIRKAVEDISYNVRAGSAELRYNSEAKL